ncbi:MAG TPA: VanZ family protein [Gammaproteobacteria bacterium]|nr:VanZ family protein [Gammaproteobacteria bacterium]
MNPQLKYTKLWLGLGALLIALIWYLSLTPEPPDTGIDNGDKIGHFLAYGLLMGWFAQIYIQLKPRLWLMLGFVLMGVLLEVLQGMTEFRTYSYADMAANSSGVFIGLLLSQGPMARLLQQFEQRLIKA